MSRYQALVFGPLEDQHQRLISVLRTDADFCRRHSLEPETTRLSRAADKLEDCCRTPQIMLHEIDNTIALQEFRCKQRICRRCARTRSLQLTIQLAPMIAALDSPRMIKLDLRSYDAPLREQFIRLTKCFANLRRTKLWKSHYNAGLWTFEVTHNNVTDLWHPHLHIVVDGRNCPSGMLSRKWLEITGDSDNVKIQYCYSQKGALRYVTKYVTKTGDVSEIPDHKIADWVLALRGLRLVNTFGGLKRPPKEEKETGRFDDYRTLTPMSVIDAAIARGAPGAIELWEGILYHAARSEPDDGSDAWATREAQRIDLLQDLENLISPAPPICDRKPQQSPNTPRLFTDHPLIGD